jgi:hypothetical protein
LATADFTRDDREDLAVANQASGSISVLLNTTAGGGLPLARPAHVRANGAVQIAARAPVAGVYHAQADYRTPSGSAQLYGCGERLTNTAGVGKVTIRPTPQALSRFRGARTLDLTIHVSFDRLDEVEIPQGNVRTTPVARRKGGLRHHARIIVHVARAQVVHLARAQARCTYAVTRP